MKHFLQFGSVQNHCMLEKTSVCKPIWFRYKEQGQEYEACHESAVYQQRTEETSKRPILLIEVIRGTER
jgi:hypothetical protein